VQRLDAAKDYARQLVPVWSDTSHEEVDAQHASATQRNQADNADDPEYQADVQHVLDVQHGLQKRGLDQKLQLNDEAPTTDRPGYFVLVPSPGPVVVEPGPQQPPQQQPPDQSPNPPPAASEQQPDPAPNGPVGIDPPVPPEQSPDEGAEDPERSPSPSVIKKLPAASITWPRSGVPVGPMPHSLGPAVAQLATRLAAHAPGAVTTGALAAGAAATVLLKPMNSQGGTIELGDGLRARWHPDQRTATIERRTSKGLFGSDFGAKWEELPVHATYDSGPDGHRKLLVNDQALKAVIAASEAGQVSIGKSALPHFQALPASKPSMVEIRIGASADGGVTTSFREATHEEIERLCPGYPMILGVGARASMEYSGLPNGLIRGNAVHNLAKIENLKISRSEEILREMDIHELLPEVAIRSGKRFSYRAKGSSVLDVAEIYGRNGEKKACVYDFKTGNATFPDATAIRYAYEIAQYANERFGGGYMQIIVAPIFVH
jgi:hypothetical protein